MQKLGWSEGRNVNYDYRWTAGNPAVMERYAAELLALKPEVIMNGGLPTLVAMQRQTRTTPIVFAQVLDPVGAGFVDSLMRPGGNITGFVSFEYSMAGKWLETLTQIAPQIKRIAGVRDLASPSEMECWAPSRPSCQPFRCRSQLLADGTQQSSNVPLKCSRANLMAA
jgi:putative tryptophan/tyrosine transport system substrate-binding protein